ncbi:DUF2812 domain-containing protein [Cohnella ginsengisoli]|uniref:DUF2812 domain-containing protein n=1 Tax=Cohnella ginsengisoli TaxID=425004 RepID=A0A9X4QP82_9BACL|nr:DUF2812 domain-containing protein [Cohnella ginsengisoli]MDG0794089.1 DUF2812 domain-containing protein [Cohnella ginsengisoli]
MRKRKWFADLLKEEKWLNDRLAEGYACRRIGSLGGYAFEPSDRKMVIRLDYQRQMSAEKYEEYKGTYADFGWTHLKGNRWGSVQYWQKPADGRDEIFSDAGSQVAFYKRLTHYALTTACLFFVYTCAIFNGNIFAALFDIKASYLTEGLWEKEGAAFWRAFLFETPFAMLRFLPAWIFGIAIVMSLYSYFHYLKRKKEYA